MSVDPAAVQRVTDGIERDIAAGAYPGALLAASRHGQVFVRRVFGTAADGSALTPEVVFPFASFSKLITATAIAGVESDGGFAWDDPVVRYLPAYGCGGKERTTVRHLVTHAAGIPLFGVPLPLAGPEDWADALARVCAAEAEWQPGSRTAYHAVSGLLVAAEIARRTSGRTFAELCVRYVLGPAGADATISVPPPYDRPEWRDLMTPGRWHPAGGFFGTVDDMLDVLHLHLTAPGLGEMHRLQYAAEIHVARRSSHVPEHEPWGIGLLLRGDHEPGWPSGYMLRWFGLTAAPSPQAFGHAGISTVIGAGDPTTGIAVAFVTMWSPTDDATMRARANAVSLLGAMLR